jgi:hypothetical protein
MFRKDIHHGGSLALTFDTRGPRPSGGYLSVWSVKKSVPPGSVRTARVRALIFPQEVVEFTGTNCVTGIT